MCGHQRILAPGSVCTLCTCLREGGGGREEGRDEPDKNLLGFGNEENMWSRVVSREYVNTEHPKEGVRYTLSPHLGKEKKNRIIPIFLTFHAWKVHICKIMLRTKGKNRTIQVHIINFFKS